MAGARYQSDRPTIPITMSAANIAGARAAERRSDRLDSTLSDGCGGFAASSVLAGAAPLPVGSFIKAAISSAAPLSL